MLPDFASDDDAKMWWHAMHGYASRLFHELCNILNEMNK